MLEPPLLQYFAFTSVHGETVTNAPITSVALLNPSYRAGFRVKSRRRVRRTLTLTQNVRYRLANTSKW